MDKSWTRFPRYSKEYQEGAKAFIEFSKKSARNPDMIICPCARCKNLSSKNNENLYEHLIVNGLDPLYKIWVFHGESSNNVEQNRSNQMSDAYWMFQDTFAVNDSCPKYAHNFYTHDDFVEKFTEAETPLYPNCRKYTKLSATMAWFGHKVRNGISDKAFDEALEILKDMLPDDNSIPESTYAVKKFLKEFNLGYEKIDACINDCCLFRKEYENLEKCPKCNASRWKLDSRTNAPQKGVSTKVLRYFPIKPRFQRMFMSKEKSEQLRWHSTHLSQDGKMRHPVDSFAWDTINTKWPDFASEPRNLRLGLATDGFNPYQNLSSKYSCWPVVLVAYNLPPNICMSHENLMLTLLIPGPEQPGNDIDIYLEPLIDDLNELWDPGVEIFDGLTNKRFNMRAILMWTINDFPAYGNLAGCTTKGEFACPPCGPNISSSYLPHSRKTVYMGHRRFLHLQHKWRTDAKQFDGTKEKRRPPKPLSGKEILLTLKNVVNDFGKDPNRRKKKKTGNKRLRRKPKSKDMQVGPKMWKKKSVFFDLPYWEDLDLRHNLDVMHIEKNICESLIGTLLDINGKSKDGLESRRDLEHMGIRKELHPQETGNRFYLPAAPHSLSKTEKQLFCERLFDLKLPDGYGSNIGKCVSVEECKLTGLKSHDYHILMQQLLPVAIRGLLPNKVRSAIFRMCSFFNGICQRVVDKNKIEILEGEIVETMCMLEKYFPPSFFDVMMHLPIHLGREVRLCGPVQYRWMYPFERFMKVLKDHVRNPSRPEGCIAEGYLFNECMRFCHEYMQQNNIVGQKHSRNEDFENEIILEGRPISAGKSKTMTDEMLKIVHQNILFNVAEAESYRQMHMDELKHEDRRLVRDSNMLQKTHADMFSTWLYKRIISNHPSTIAASDKLRWLARGPRRYYMSYSGYIINGKRYHTIGVERSTQDYGVFIEAETICRSSARDTTHTIAKVSYYGFINDIILLDFHTFRLPVFQCTWANIVGGVKEEEGFTLVNLHEGISQFQRDPFILASQAKQVFYSRETETSNWYVVLKAPPRGFHDFDAFYENIAYAPQDVSKLNSDNADDNESYVRGDCEGVLV